MKSTSTYAKGLILYCIEGSEEGRFSGAIDGASVIKQLLLEKSGNFKSLEKSEKLEIVSGKLEIIAKFTHRNYRSPLL